ncbi:MAG: hypothetical protein IJ659_02685 [Alloprevotella sp.]|nr:hypothetical protein [Alloprevotella sp.]
MKRILPFILLLLPLLPMQAQTARSVMDRAAAKLQKAGGMQATFETTSFRCTQEQATTRGTIQVQDRKFRVASEGGDIWFDGKTQWSLLAGSDEVNVTTPSRADVQKLNPYHFINLYKQGYTLRLTSATYQGKSVKRVDMTANTRGADIQKMTILLDQTDTPVNVRLKDGKGNWFRFRIKSLKTGQKFTADTFQYNPADHPGIEVIDLR